jgi:spore coat polysaccharide biosynthesis protein SpsF
MKVGYLITARLKSTRLPEKLLRQVEDKPIFVHMLDRLKSATRVDEIVICTSTHPQDEHLVKLAASEGVSCFRGDEEDVLNRLYEASRTYNFDYILNITADCPFVDPVYADKIVDAYKENNADLIRSFGLPHGAFSYGIKPAALAKAIEIKNDNHTEVWGRYFTDTDLFDVYDLPITNKLHTQPELRMTLDYPEDLEFFKAVFAALYKPGEVFSLDEILNYLTNHPEVVKINAHCARAFKKRFVRQSEIKLKPRYEVHSAAVIGCGSIGQRHIRNLREAGITDITTLRSRKGHYQNLDPSLSVQEVTEWDDLLDKNPDIAIISNPTSLHLEIATRLLPHVRGILIEKPLSHSLEGVSEFLQKTNDHRKTTFVGYNLQFHPVVRQIEEMIDQDLLGEPLILQCQVGHWLPDWHPYEDYRNAYTARPDLGGGVSLTLIHEIHMAMQLLGPAQTVSCLLTQFDDLPLGIDVISDMMFQHQSGAVSQLHLDFIQRPAHRSGVLSGTKGWLRYDIYHPKISAQFIDQASPMVIWENRDYNSNQQYVDELDLFLTYVREGRIRHRFDAWSAAQSLAMVSAAFEGARTGRKTPIPEV